jgi:thiol-disulfide isomerase/thioredoxin
MTKISKYLFLVLLALGAFQLISIFIPKSNIAEGSKLRAGSFFPKQKFLNQDGDTISIQDFKGKYVLVNFWFAGCKPCRNGMAKFTKLIDQYPDNLTIVSYNGADADSVQQNIYRSYNPTTTKNWHFGHPIDPLYGDNLVSYYAISRYPSYFLLDKTGKIINEPPDATRGVHQALDTPFWDL